MGPQGAQGPQCCPISVDWSSLVDLKCPTSPTPLAVTGIFVQWMRNHFSDSANIDLNILKESVWTNDISTSAIIIDSVFRWKPDTTEFRPGIFVKRNPWKILRYGIDDRKMMGVNDGTCTRAYNTMFQGSHTLFCIAGESGEVELLATEVYHELIQFGPRARKHFNFLRFVVSDIGEPAILEEATENFVVPIVVSYGGQYTWTICPPSIQELSLGLDQ